MSYRHKTTNEVTSIAPNAYQRLPEGKSKEAVLSEAAQLVLSFIKSKISKHIKQQEELKETLENPLTPEEKIRKEKMDKNALAEGSESDVQQEEVVDEMDRKFPLSAYQYDIETIEMLAEMNTNLKAQQDKDPVEIRKENRAFMFNSGVRTFDAGYFIGPTLYETDVNSMSIAQIRNIVEDLSVIEDKLDAQLGRVRTSLKEFSFVLLGQVTAADRVKERELMLEMHRVEKEKKLEKKRLLLENRRKEKERKEKIEQERQARLVERKEREARREEKRKQNEQIFSADNLELLSSEKVVKGDLSEKLSEKMNDSQEIAVSSELPPVNEEGPDPAPTSPDLEVAKDSDLEESEEDLLAEEIEVPETADGPKMEVDLGQTDSESEAEVDLPLPDEQPLPQKDYGSILFGNLQLLPEDAQVPEDIIETCGKLVNFAVFCGFTNLRISEYSYDSNFQFSLPAAAKTSFGKYCKQINMILHFTRIVFLFFK